MEKLNVEADALATAAHDLTDEWRGIQEVEVLPGEKWAYFLQDQKITSALKPAVLTAYHRPALLHYIQDTYGWDDEDALLIDTIGIGATLRRLGPARRATQVKCMHDWLPTAAFLAKQNRADHGTCCVCQMQCDETASRMLSCPHAELLRQREALWKDRHEDLRDNHSTCPSILRIWDTQIRTLLGLQDPVRSGLGSGSHPSPLQRLISESRAHQAQLGWDMFLRGFISTKWGAAQEAYLAQRVDTARHKSRWLTVVVGKMLLIHSTVWGNRNRHIHGATEQDQ